MTNHTGKNHTWIGLVSIEIKRDYTLTDILIQELKHLRSKGSVKIFQIICPFPNFLGLFCDF